MTILSFAAKVKYILFIETQSRQELLGSTCTFVRMGGPAAKEVMVLVKFNLEILMLRSLIHQFEFNTF